MKPRNISELAEWIRKRLGSPLVDAMIETSQLEDCIDFACDYFTEHAGGIGHEEQIMLIKTMSREDIAELYESEQNVADEEAPRVSRLIWRSEYQLPRCVYAISDTLQSNPLIFSRHTEPIGRNLAYAETFGGIGGLAGPNTMGGAYGFFFPGATSFSSAYGSAGGQGTRPAGGGIDLVSYEIGLQYMEMLRQQYSVKLNAQFMEQKRRVRFSPAPSEDGLIALSVWSRVYDEYLYDNLWIKQYALAQAKIQIAHNVKKYSGVTFPGGGQIDGDFYLSEGKESVEKLEQQLRDNDYSYPPQAFYLG